MSSTDPQYVSRRGFIGALMGTAAALSCSPQAPVKRDRVYLSSELSATPALDIVEVDGPGDAVARGRVRLNTRNGRTPVQYRVARHVDDLPYSHWRPVTADVMEFRWWFPGYQEPSNAPVVAEVQYSDDGPNVVLSTAHPSGLRPLHKQEPDAASVHMAPPGYLAQIIFDSEDEWRVQQYNDTSPRPFSNNFIPLDWSPVLDVNGVPTGRGYGWSTEHSRALDAGGAPETIIAAHTKIRWMNPAVDAWDFSPSSTRYVVTLAGNNLDLKGGGAYFAVLSNFPDGRRGRYHLLGSTGSPRKLAIGTVDSPLTTDQFFPSGSSPDWMCSFGADGVPIAEMPRGPSFHIEAFEVVLRGFAAPPTGQLIFREFAIIQDPKLDS